ncbi:MAG TPA: dipicolinate synthase subunit DpsA [Clostridiales bacterium]|nr:dipicolinate synthase subunit DpsA [Clostridiales bacterium]
MDYKYDASIIGGDSRQTYLASVLKKSGFKIIAFGLVKNTPEISDTADSLRQAMESSRTLITPIPFSKDKMNINSMCGSNGNDYDLSIKTFTADLRRQHYLIGGNLPIEITEMCKAKNISYYDLMKDENIALLNAISTAEGAIAEAIFKSNINLHYSNVLVLGYGKCGSVLSSKLKALGARVTVAARKESALTEAYTNGLDYVKLGTELDISNFNFIFNTIPALILDEKILLSVSPDATIIDIASAPGGIDYECAKKLNLNAHLCLGIPGKTAPKSSAEFIAKAIIPILKERSD